MSEEADRVTRRMRDQLEDVQVKTAAKEKPWYRNGATLVAALTLLFSLGTTAASYADAPIPRALVGGLINRSLPVGLVFNVAEGKTPSPSEEVDRVIGRMRDQIEDLQVKAAAKEKPWYRDGATLVAALAFVFSLGTTAVAYAQTRAHDIKDKRHELRTLLQRLAALPKENIDAGRTYADDPASRGMVSGFINQENSLLAQHAVEIIRSLPTDAVSAAEYQALAVAVQVASDTEGAKTLLEAAVKAAKDFNTEIAAQRMLASLYFVRGHPETGRVEYQRALAIFSKYTGFDRFTITSTNVWTELAWAASEANSDSLPLAIQHVQSAAALVTPLPPSPGSRSLLRQIDQALQLYMTGGVPVGPAGVSPTGPPLVPVVPK